LRVVPIYSLLIMLPLIIDIKLAYLFPFFGMIQYFLTCYCFLFFFYFALAYSALKLFFNMIYLGKGIYDILYYNKRQIKFAEYRAVANEAYRNYNKSIKKAQTKGFNCALYFGIITAAKIFERFILPRLIGEGINNMQSLFWLFSFLLAVNEIYLRE
jgi:hypothetical protein